MIFSELSSCKKPTISCHFLVSGYQDGHTILSHDMFSNNLNSQGTDCLLDPGIYPYLVYFKINHETKEAFLRGTTIELRENNYSDGKLVHQLLLVIYATALF